MKLDRKQLGAYGEKKVAEWLQQKGFTIQETNYRKKYGEIDIIATRNDIVAFIEVKFRTTHYFNLSEVITPSKQRKIIKTAKTYILESGMIGKIYRFDVALLEKHIDKFKLTYVPNAFTQRRY